MDTKRILIVYAAALHHFRRRETWIQHHPVSSSYDASNQPNYLVPLIGEASEIWKTSRLTGPCCSLSGKARRFLTPVLSPSDPSFPFR